MGNSPAGGGTTGPSSTIERTILSFPGGNQIQVNTDITTNHYTTWTITVNNLTRNVLVRSSGTDTGANTAYIQNLAQTAVDFNLVWGEFAYLGENANGHYGIEFDGNMVRGSISSSTVREGYQGISRVLGTPEGLKRFVSINESPYHGFNLCLGTTAEMLRDPKTEIHDVIRELGGRKKIFNVHFRNIRGGRDDFQEVYPDEGDMNMVHVAQSLQEVEYPYMLMPDHVPSHPEDPGGRQGFAFSYGYIKGILQTLETAA